MEILHASAVILINQQYVLIADRPADKPIMPGYWEFPGGKLHKNETPEQCLLREAKEELGITLLHPKPFTFISETRRPKEDTPYHVIVYIYQCYHWQGTPSGKEGQQLVWTTLDELTNYPLLPANIPLIPLIRKIIEV